MVSIPASFRCSLVRPIMSAALLLFIHFSAEAISASVTGSMGELSSLHNISIASTSRSTICLYSLSNLVFSKEDASL